LAVVFAFSIGNNAAMADSSIQAVVLDTSKPDRFVIRDVPSPLALANQAVVRVKAISLNRGEVRRSMTAPDGHRPGWDFAGIVEQPAADGSGPKAGSCVVGLLNTGSWSQLVAAPTQAIAPIADNVKFSQAATLPVAGLTALHSLYKGGLMLGKSVLITGATGGTGDFACQLAKLAGAKVVATIRSPDREAFVKSLGVDHVVIGDDPSPAANFGPYQLIIDSVGGPHFGKVLAMLGVGGTHVIFGTTGGAEPTINASKFYSTGGVTLYGLIIFHELQHESPSIGLKKLADLVSAGKLVPHIELETSWRNVAEVAKNLMDRKFAGKAVLTLD
jgi:NADPH:quinone reductase-like Zn-dependent oxidoreductase